MSRSLRLASALSLVLAATTLPSASAATWSTETRVRMADMALRVAPPHLVGQIEKHHQQWHAGLRAAAGNDPTIGPQGEPTSVTVSLAPLIQAEVERAVNRIVEHRPFGEIVFQLGVVSYWVAAANDPLLEVGSSRRYPAYWRDYSGYLEDASERFSVLYYPHDRRAETPAELERMLERSLERSKEMAPRIAAEYERIGSLDGRQLFDDRSTAFGVGSLAFSHGVSDIAGVLRYIWLRAGGADTLVLPTLDEDHLILISAGSKSH